jgi:isopentenyl diphosphate isomerase/L-lactate dehydrogenase-like FMN-dependent dehydrogenase
MSQPDPVESGARAPGVRRQMDIYQGGLVGKRPAQAVSVDELEEQARAALKPEAFDYVAGGAGSEDAVRANREAFRRWRIVPRMLRDVARRDLSVDVLGQRLPAPLALAPIGVQSIIHSEAERAAARAARATGVPFVLSTASSVTIEEIAAEMGDAPRWFQLYWPRGDELAASFLRRAERAGYGAVVVTLDTHLLGWRERDLHNAYLPFLAGEGLANYFSDPVFRAAIGGDPRDNMVKAVEHFGAVFSDPSHTWDDLAKLREATSLPILLKGVLHPNDARRAVDHGASGVIVSNHGGRQVDGSVAALDALPRVVAAVGDRTTVLFDSGIRRGADVVKAMALGARCVLLGRPYAYGLAVNGEQGVRDVITNLLADLDLTFALSGCTSFDELSRANLVEADDRAGVSEL